jgi:hypothetical protein
VGFWELEMGFEALFFTLFHLCPMKKRWREGPKGGSSVEPDMDIMMNHGVGTKSSRAGPTFFSSLVARTANGGAVFIE